VSVAREIELKREWKQRAWFSREDNKMQLPERNNRNERAKPLYIAASELQGSVNYVTCISCLPRAWTDYRARDLSSSSFFLRRGSPSGETSAVRLHSLHRKRSGCNELSQNARDRIATLRNASKKQLLNTVAKVLLMLI